MNVLLSGQYGEYRGKVSQTYLSATSDEELVIDRVIAMLVKHIDTAYSGSRVANRDWANRSVDEADGGRDRTAAFVVTDRLLMFCARDVGEVKDAAVETIRTANKLGEPRLREDCLPGSLMVHAVFCFLLSECDGIGAQCRGDFRSASSTSGEDIARGKDWICHHQASDTDEAGDDHEDLKKLHVCHVKIS
jgi:hypothetical protein